MDETLLAAPLPSGGGPRADGSDAAAAVTPPSSRARQTALPFHDEADEPVGYALTATARRLVAPERVAVLRVVPPTAPDGAATAVPSRAASLDPNDIRPARARAMRRAGHDLEDIALRLAVAPEAVERWVADVRPVRARRSGRRGPTRPAAAGAAEDVVPAPVPTVRSDGPTRRRAAREAAARLGSDVVLARDLALLAGAARTTGATVAVSLSGLGLAAAVIDRLRTDAGLERHGVRVVLRVGPARPADRARHEWSDGLGLPLERISAVRWPLAADPEDVDATLHLVDAEVIARVLGWIDAVATSVTDIGLRRTS